MCSQRVRVLFFLFFVAASADFATGLAGMVQFALNGKADRAGLRSLHDSPSFIDEPPLKILPTEIQPILPTEAIAQPCEFLEPPGSVIASAQREDQIKVCDGSRAGLPLARHDDHDHDGHEGGHGNTWSLIGHKIGALLVMVVITITGCIIPILLRRTKFFFRVMTYVNSFACGAFLGLAFFHLLPEALYLTESARLGFTVGHNWYNLLYPLCFFGFVLILLFEKVLLVGVQREVAVVGHCHGVNECVVVDMSSDFKRHHHHHDHHDKDCMEQSLQTADGVHVDSAEHTKSVSSSTGSFKAVHRFSAVTLLATLSLSIHSIFEGMVVGTFDDSMSVWVATVSICGHKWAAGFALAANCVKANVVSSYFDSVKSLTTLYDLFVGGVL